MNKVDVSIANVKDEAEMLYSDLESSKARGIDPEAIVHSIERKEADERAMQRLRGWIVECAENGELSL